MSAVLPNTKRARSTASFGLSGPRSGEYTTVQSYNKIARQLATNNVLPKSVSEFDRTRYPRCSVHDLVSFAYEQVSAMYTVAWSTDQYFVPHAGSGSLRIAAFPSSQHTRFDILLRVHAEKS